MREWNSGYPCHQSPMFSQCTRNTGEKPVAEWKKITLCMSLTSCISFYQYSDLPSVFCHNVIALLKVLEEISSCSTTIHFIFFCGKQNCWLDFSKPLKMKTWGRKGEVLQTFLKVFFPGVFLKSGQKTHNKRIPIVFVTLLPFSKLAKRTVLHVDVEAPTPTWNIAPSL